MTENSMLAQCLDFSRQLIANKEAFKFDVKISSGFSFNFNNLDQEPTKSRKEEVRKKSPSTLKRNAARKLKFLEQKKTSSETSFKCDQCDLEVNCKVSLRKHIEKHHKVIPQLDGLEDGNSEEEKSSQTEGLNVKKVEVQTDPMDTTVIVKWGEENHIPLPTGTVVLKIELGPEVTYVPINYPAMSSPAPWVHHPLWGLGKLEDDDDEEYISYRFNDKKVHTGGKKKA